MHPEPLIDDLAARLRDEPHDPSSTDRLLASLRSAPRRLPVTRLALAAGVAALAAVALVPRSQGPGAAWAQVLASARSDVPVHIVSRDAKGDKSMEVWGEGVKRATILWDRDGNVYMENRDDGQRRIAYFKGLNGDLATLSPVRGRSPFDPAASDARKILRWYAMSGPGPTGPVRNGALDVWTLAIPGQEAVRVESDPATGRVLRVFREESVETFKYPADVPDSVFEPRLRVARARVYDTAGERRRLLPGLTRGLGTKGDVTLRLVARDVDGALWVLWTGPAPDGAYHRPVRVIGARVGKPFGYGALTDRGGPPKSVVSPLIGKRIVGMALPLKGATPREVTVEIPVPGGYRMFANVPVQPLLSIRHWSGDLGFQWY